MVSVRLTFPPNTISDPIQWVRSSSTPVMSIKIFKLSLRRYTPMKDRRYYYV